MSAPSKTALKTRLLQLKCHFTWQLLEKDSDPDHLKDTLDYQLKYNDTKKKYMVYNLLAYTMYLKDDYTEAINKLGKAEEAVTESNTGATCRSYLVTFGNYAWVYYYMNQYEDAQRYIDKIDNIYDELKSSPHGTEDIAEIYGEQGWALLTFFGQYCQRAKECFEKALEIAPEESAWHSGHAIALYRVEDLNWKCGRKCPPSEWKSQDVLRHAITLDPKDAVLKVILALKLQDLHREKEGRKYIQEAQQLAPNSPYLLRYVAMFYRKSGMVDESLAVLQEALALMPTSSFLHHQIGLCYRWKMIDAKKSLGSRYKNTEEIDEFINKAIFHFEKVLEYKKTFVYAHSDLANMYCEAKDYQKADEIFKKVLQFNNLTNNEKQQMHQRYATFQEDRMKSQSKAIEHYKKSFQIPGPCLSRDISEKALKRLAERRIQGFPSDASGFGLLGFVNKINDKIANAIKCYEQALKYDPDNEEYLSELCDLRLKT